MKILDNLLHGFNSYMKYMGRARAREALLRSSDRMLEDAGFSRELLESGVKAWPWHMPALALSPLDFKQDRNVAAIRELQTYSDKELNDLAISRNSIREAVMFGRDGIDNNSERKVA